MDSPSTVIVDEDTTFALMWEMQARGHRVDHALIAHVELEGDHVHVLSRAAELSQNRDRPMVLGQQEATPIHLYDAVWIRKDPPFDAQYLWTTLILEHARSQTLIVNDPRGLREANEKLYTCWFRELMPETLVSQDKERIREFVKRIGGRAVIKPLDAAGGEGVLGLALDDNFNAIIEMQTQRGKRVAMVQRYLPQVKAGDKRVLILDGEPLGAILRVPRSDELRSNIHVGGKVESAEITARDREIVAALAPRLQQDGLFFVGIDVIGGVLTEVNVTSPTGIQQMSRLTGRNLPATVIDWLQARVAAKQ